VVSSIRENSGTLSRIVVCPNQSISWAHTKLVFLVITAVSLTVALGFSLIGFWPVLPFAGLELAALGACLYHCAHRNQVREVITVDDGTVTVERGRRGPEQRWSFQNCWLSVLLIRPPSAWHPSRLVLRESGRSVELGRFLSDGERQALADELSCAINDDRLVRGVG